MTSAETLTTRIASIVDGGFIDPLWDSDIACMAREIDPSARIIPYGEASDQFFKVCFTDQSEAVFDVCGN